MKSRGPWEEGECDEKPSHVRPMSREGSALLTFCFCGGDGWINQEIGGDREPSEFLAAGRQSGKKSSAGRTTGKLDARLPIWGWVEGVGTQVGRVMSSALAAGRAISHRSAQRASSLQSCDSWGKKISAPSCAKSSIFFSRGLIVSRECPSLSFFTYLC